MRKATAAAIGLLLVATACTSGGGGTSTSAPPNPVVNPGFRPRPGGGLSLFASTGLQAFDACDAFLDYVIDHALELVGPYGLFDYGYGWGPVLLEEAPAATAAGDGFANRSGTPVAGVDYSTTNVQEVGVDEPDIVKTDGNRIVAIAQGRLHYVDTSSGRPVLRGSLPLEGGWNHQIVMSGDRVLVLANSDRWSGGPVVTPEVWAPDVVYYGGQMTVLSEIDVSDPTDMKINRTLFLDGTYLSARMIEDTARIVVRSFPTGFEFEFPKGPGLRAEREAEQRNREIIRESSIDNWVPYYVLENHVTGVTTEGTLLDCDQVGHPEEFSGLGMLTVLTVDLSAGLRPGSGIGILAEGETVYASTDNLYVATNPWFDWPRLAAGEIEGPKRMATQIHKFDISDPDVAVYRATGEVPGFMLSQWSMSEQDGVLRVASTDTSPIWGWGPGRESQSFVTTLEERDGELEQLGLVAGLGRSEQIFAVRFIGDVGYVVTFRQTDPLYTIDLSDPTDPEVIGELKILGYSAYLHPLGDGLLLGVGQDATEQGRTLGTQISVFDISNLGNPIRLHKLTMSDAWSEVEWDHKAFMHWPPTGLTVMPIQRWSWDDRTGTEDWFAGALGVKAGRNGIEEVGTVTHLPTKTKGDEYWYEWGAQIRRSIVIGKTLYTVSEIGIKASDLDTLTEEAWVLFN